MPGGKHCCEAVSDYFRQLFCVSQVLNFFSARTPSTEHRDAPNTGTSLVSFSENNNSPATTDESNRFLSCEKCDPRNMGGSQGKQIKELPTDAVPGGETQETGATDADDASTPTVETCGHFFNWRSAVNTCTPSASWYEAEEATSATTGKRSTCPAGTETSRRAQLTQDVRQSVSQRAQESSGSPVSRRPTARSAERAGAYRERGRDVVILRGYRDIMPLIRPPYSKASEWLSTGRMQKWSSDSETDSAVDSQSSASSEDCPPWLPLCEQRPHTAPAAAAARECATEEGQPTYTYSRHGAARPWIDEQPTAGKNREEPVTAGCSCESVGDHQSLPVTTEEEEPEAADEGGRRRDSSPVAVLGRNAARFTRSPSDRGASTGGRGVKRRHSAAADGWQGAPAPAPAGSSRGRRGRRGRAAAAVDSALPLRALRTASWALWHRRCRHAHTVLPYAQFRRPQVSKSSSVVAITSLRRRIHRQKQRVRSQRGTGTSQNPGGSPEHLPSVTQRSCLNRDNLSADIELVGLKKVTELKGGVKHTV